METQTNNLNHKADFKKAKLIGLIFCGLSALMILFLFFLPFFEKEIDLNNLSSSQLAELIREGSVNESFSIFEELSYVMKDLSLDEGFFSFFCIALDFITVVLIIPLLVVSTKAHLNKDFENAQYEKIKIYVATNGVNAKKTDVNASPFGTVFKEIIMRMLSALLSFVITLFLLTGILDGVTTRSYFADMTDINGFLVFLTLGVYASMIVCYVLVNNLEKKYVACEVKALAERKIEEAKPKTNVAPVSETNEQK